MNKKILLLLPALALVLGGCNAKKNSSASGSDSGASSQTVAVESVEINKSSATLDPGETLQLTAVAKPSTLTDKSVKWSSNTPAVATVSSGGLVTAVAEGTAKIKAAANADETKFAECTITVNKKMIIVKDESIDLERTYKLGISQTQLGKNIYFNGKTIDSNGLRFDSTESWSEAVDVKVEGTADHYHLAATIDGAKKYLNTVSGTDYHAAIGDTATTDYSWDDTYFMFTCMVNGTKYFLGTNGTYTTISFSNYNSYAASNDHLRLMYKVEPVDPTSVDIVEATADVYADNSVQLHAKCSPIGASEATVVWSIEEDNANGKVSVNQQGVVSATADAVVGNTVTVKATWGSLPGDTCVVTVRAALNYGTLDDPLSVNEAVALINQENPTTQTMYVAGIVSSNEAYNSSFKNWGNIYLTNDDGTVAQAFIGFRAKPKDGSNYETTYAAADSLFGKRVVFSGTGKIYSAKYELDAGCILESVTDGGVVATAIEFDTSDFELEQGANKTIKTTLKPYGATGAISWSVDPESAGVSVNNGVVAATDSAPEGDYTIRAELTSNPLIYKEVTCSVVAGGGGGSSFTVDFSAKTASHNNYADEWTYGDVKLAGAANNNGGWEFVKFGPKSATISDASYLGTYVKTTNALTFAVTDVTINLVGKCYNQADEKASVHIEAYSDAGYTTKVAETTAQEVPAITTNEGTGEMNFSFTAPAANRYYKVVFDITNTTTYNGVAAVKSIVFSE